MTDPRAFSHRRRRLLQAGLGGGLLGVGVFAQAAGPARALDRDAVLHAVSRLSFGPAPGELARVEGLGVDRYLDEQLQPERLAEPPALAAQLAALATTRLPQATLVHEFREAQKAAKADKDKDDDAAKASRRALLAQVGFEAGQDRMLRALWSPRQLQEVLVDFWFNHFNVFVGKGLDRVLVEPYEREAIRPHVLGRFRDLLGATAHHPAMLFYLDNWLSVAPGFQPRQAGGNKQRASGLNENYARELMELHTLGVDGGYTQQDVTQLARILTGWTFDPQGRRNTGDSLFVFDPRRHDDGTKQWLGRTVAPRGQGEGEWALDLLARHPSTAHHLAFQLAQAFVADVPPDALVQRLAQRFLATDGDLREVLRALFASAEFRDPSSFGAKFKPPYRYVLSAVRASGLSVANTRPLLATLQQLGMPLHGCQTPDGYKNTEDAWLNPDAITRRVAFATALAAGRLPLMADPAVDPKMGAKALDRAADRATAPEGPGGVLDAAATPVDADALLATLGDSVSARTRSAVAQARPGLRAALVLGGPDFMRH